VCGQHQGAIGDGVGRNGGENERFDIKFSVDYAADIVTYKRRPGEYASHVRTSELSFEKIVGLREEIDHDVRSALGLPAPGAGSDLDHSMGQMSPPPKDRD